MWGRIVMICLLGVKTPNRKFPTTKTNSVSYCDRSHASLRRGFLAKYLITNRLAMLLAIAPPVRFVYAARTKAPGVR